MVWGRVQVCLGFWVFFGGRGSSGVGTEIIRKVSILRLGLWVFCWGAGRGGLLVSRLWL